MDNVVKPISVKQTVMFTMLRTNKGTYNKCSTKAKRARAKADNRCSHNQNRLNSSCSSSNSCRHCRSKSSGCSKPLLNGQSSLRPLSSNRQSNISSLFRGATKAIMAKAMATD